jgi:hypothetical protein
MPRYIFFFFDMRILRRVFTQAIYKKNVRLIEELSEVREFKIRMIPGQKLGCYFS